MSHDNESRDQKNGLTLDIYHYLYHFRPRVWATNPYLSADSLILNCVFSHEVIRRPLLSENSHLCSVLFPAPCPAFLCIRISSGCGLFGIAYCSAAACLKECKGTTRSSSIRDTIQLLSVRIKFLACKYVRSAVVKSVGGKTLSVGTLCRGEYGYMKSKSCGSSGFP